MFTNEDLNIRAIHQFKNSLADFEEYGSIGFSKKCFINYKSQNLKNKSEILNVSFVVNGANPSINIDVENVAKIITADIYHLDFEPRYSNIIRYNEDESNLEINGNSPKMGKYLLTITPID